MKLLLSFSVLLRSISAYKIILICKVLISVVAVAVVRTGCSARINLLSLGNTYLCVVAVLFSQCQSSYWGDHGWKIGDDDDVIARNAYESLLRFNIPHIICQKGLRSIKMK